MISLDESFICPYCAAYNKLKAYEPKIVGGKIRSLTCPECKEKMRRETLINSISPREWGAWLYLSIRRYNSNFYKFYDKVHMDKLFPNLNKQDFITRRDFWAGWKEAKEGYPGTDKWLTQIELKMYPYRQPRLRLDKFISDTE